MNLEEKKKKKKKDEKKRRGAISCCTLFISVIMEMRDKRKGRNASVRLATMIAVHRLNQLRNSLHRA